MTAARPPAAAAQPGRAVTVADWMGCVDWPQYPILEPFKPLSVVAVRVSDQFMLAYRPSETQPCGVAVVRKVTHD